MVQDKNIAQKQWQAEHELGLARVMPWVYSLLFVNHPFPTTGDSPPKTRAGCAQVVISLYAMICLLMTKRRKTWKQIEAHVRLFLSCVNRLCKLYWKGDKVPFWASTGNFPTLLCLGKQFDYHGDMRWYWEGTGERYIQYLKRVLVSMRRTPDYFAGKMKKNVQRQIHAMARGTILHRRGP